MEKEKEHFSLALAEQTIPSGTPLDSTEMDQHYAELAELYKQKRISLVNDYLKITSDSTSIFTTQSPPEAPENVRSNPKFEVGYSMRDSPEENLK